jgi:signal transduction histidine kinase
MKRRLNNTTMVPDKTKDIDSPSGGMGFRARRHHENLNNNCSDSNLILMMGADDSEPMEKSQQSSSVFPVSEINTSNRQPQKGEDNSSHPNSANIKTTSSPNENGVFQSFDTHEHPSRSNRILGRSDSDASSVVSRSRGVEYRCMAVSLGLVILVGITACIIILTVGLLSVRDSQQSRFEHTVEDVVSNYEMIVHDYLTLGLWTHEACLEAQESENPRDSFRRFWEYVRSGDFPVKFVGCAINVTHDERAAYENETRTFLAESNLTLMGVDASLLYFGFKEATIDLETQSEKLAPRSEQPYYIPNHFVEPVEDPVVLMNMDIDGLSVPSFQDPLYEAFKTNEPSISGRINRSAQFQMESDYPEYGISLAHPGVRIPGKSTKHVAVIPVSCNDVLKRVQESRHDLDNLKVVVYDTTPNATNIAGDTGPVFLCGATLYLDDVVRDEGTSMKFIGDIPLDQSLESDRGSMLQAKTIEFASREWTLVISSPARSDQGGQMAFIALGAILILVSTIGLSLLIYTNAKKIRSIGRIKASVKAEKALIRLENARKAAQQERDLNDFIAHEVRNPLNAALAANTFVSASVNEAEPLITEEKRASVREDVQIIDNSLHFINDFLRNMLDMQRAESKQLIIEWAFVDLKRDILEPVASMLYRRGVAFEVIVDCPIDHLVVESDSLRLKQVVLNLGRNAAKFVEKGFVRLRADVLDGDVHIFIEDSGSGVPKDKQDNLFGRFQESLDSLNQGTGIGLALCKNLTELLGGRIWLDKEYNSGIEGYPGACFVINLRTPPIQDDGEEVEETISSHESKQLQADDSYASPTSRTAPLPPKFDQSPSSDPTDLPPNATELPAGLSVLFVDDDFTLRKLFVRAVTRVTEGWNVDQASNGETAVRVTAENASSYFARPPDSFLPSSLSL